MPIAAVLTTAAEGGFIAFDPQTRTMTPGESRDDARSNLHDAVAPFRDEFPASQ